MRSAASIEHQTRCIKRTRLTPDKPTRQTRSERLDLIGISFFSFERRRLGFPSKRECPNDLTILDDGKFERWTVLIDKRKMDIGKGENILECKKRLTILGDRAIFDRDRRIARDKSHRIVITERIVFLCTEIVGKIR